MAFSITEIKLNGQRSGMVTDDRYPVIELRTEGVPQFWQLRIKENGKTVADSGQQPYQSPFIPLEVSLQPKTNYHVTLKAWDAAVQDQAELTFETGFMGTPWQASWIEPIQEAAIPEIPIRFYEIFMPWPEPEEDGEKLRPGQLLRRCFSLEHVPNRARLYATAHGVYHLRLNGIPVSQSRLAPEISAYEKRLYYQCYDICSMLKTGENILEAELCDGWWIGRIGLSGDSCQYGDRLGFLAQLELDDRIIGTDEHWECRKSHICYSDLYIGEKWDLCQPEQSWKHCVVAQYPMNHLKMQPIPGIRVVQELEGTCTVTPDGDLVVDFGQTVAGVVHLEAQLKKKTEIILEHSETLDRNGEFFKNIIGRNKQQRDRIIADAGKLVFEPRHTYHGFRYVRISGITIEEIVSVTAMVLGTPLDTTGTFQCSDPRLNRLQENIQWSMRGNMISIPTDCPQREKMGWTGDLQMFTKTGCFNMELLPFLSAWMENLRLEQKEDGEVPLIIPNFPRTDAMQREMEPDNTSSAWGDACVLVPWYLYQCTGDTRILRDNFDAMKKWLSFIARAAAAKPDNYDSLSAEAKARNPYLWQSGHHFGDWMIPSLSANPADISRGSELTGHVIASCFYAITVRAWIGVLDALQKEYGDTSLWMELVRARCLLEKICSAVQAEYITDDGHVRGELQGVYVLSLYSGVVQGELRKKVAQNLVRMIEEDGGKLDTGFVSTPYLLDVLCDNGYRALAYRLLFSEEPPSWLYQVKMGATTIWEKWQAVLPDGAVTTASMNHYALGSVGDWIYRNIGGIEVAAPGYAKVRFAPDVNCGLSWSHCEKSTAFGKVSCCWEKTDKGTYLHLETPVQAELIMNGNKETLTPGSHARKL